MYLLIYIFLTFSIVNKILTYITIVVYIYIIFLSSFYILVTINIYVDTNPIVVHFDIQADRIEDYKQIAQVSVNDIMAGAMGNVERVNQQNNDSDERNH